MKRVSVAYKLSRIMECERNLDYWLRERARVLRLKVEKEEVK